LTGLRQRLDEEDGPGARAHAHALKGAAATVAAQDLHAIAVALEANLGDAGTPGELDRCGQLLPRAIEEFDRFRNILERTGWV
jgi:HPt (histidine-containing phosphotransfer) domain-containing protein